MPMLMRSIVEPFSINSVSKKYFINSNFPQHHLDLFQHATQFHLCGCPVLGCAGATDGDSFVYGRAEFSEGGAFRTTLLAYVRKPLRYFGKREILPPGIGTFAVDVMVRC